ncbi:unnamed protein product [Allacma fusca]|uniref:Uncharacterized protein n=1 Tax=Allacma fusca TaxID=39272 RepID=A0A8J2P7L9_9HEXA|nr:unnamed protein product [Allacma fusca]
MESQVGDPDLFARKRLWQRVVIIFISQLVSSVAAAYQIYGIVSSSFDQQTNFVADKFNKIPCGEGKDCCNTSFLRKLYREKEHTKSEGLLSFVAVFAISSSGMIICIANYLAFIKYNNPYLRKVVINILCLTGFIGQVINCTTFYNGLEQQNVKSKEYCDPKAKDFHNPAIQSCLQILAFCPNFNFFFTLWAMMIFTTVLIPIITIYSCKWRERVFSQLAEDLAYRRKALLHSWQRSMIHGVKIDLELDLDFERKSLQQLEISIQEEYEMLKSFEESFKISNKLSRQDMDTTAKKVLNHEFQCYLEKLAEYNSQMAAVLNKAEALQELRKLDLEELKTYTNKQPSSHAS